jgi:hypothetical protein
VAAAPNVTARLVLLSPTPPGRTNKNKKRSPRICDQSRGVDADGGARHIKPAKVRKSCRCRMTRQTISLKPW